MGTEAIIVLGKGIGADGELPEIARQHVRMGASLYAAAPIIMSGAYRLFLSHHQSAPKPWQCASMRLNLASLVTRSSWRRSLAIPSAFRDKVQGFLKRRSVSHFVKVQV